MAALAVLGIAGQASAATFVVNQTANITGLGKQAIGSWQIGEDYVPGGRFQPDVAVTMAEGDTLDWTVMFVGGIGNYLYTAGPLEFTAHLTPDNNGDFFNARTSGTLDFLDQQGGVIASATRTNQVQTGMGSGYYGTDFASVTTGVKLYGFHYVGTLDELIDSGDQITFRYGTAFVSGATAVPEPATWAMMIAGFGLVGAALRRKRPAAVVAVG